MAWVLVRQFRERKLGVATWVLPVLPIIVGVLQLVLRDRNEPSASIGLGLGVVAAGVVLGAVYGAFISVHRDPAGAVLYKAGWTAVPVWALLIATRTVFEKAGDHFDAPTSFGYLAISFGVMLLARTAGIALRAKPLAPGASAARTA
ncbi:hypothetical protein [Streptomyces sp. NPDC054786]